MSEINNGCESLFSPTEQSSLLTCQCWTGGHPQGQAAVVYVMTNVNVPSCWDTPHTLKLYMQLAGLQKIIYTTDEMKTNHFKFIEGKK